MEELLEIAKDIRDTLNDVRKKRKLTFKEEEHEYSIFDPSKNKIISDLPSVSTLLKKWYTPFDEVSKSIEMMCGDTELAKDLRDKWNLKGKTASEIGSYVHYKLEQYVWSIFDIDKNLRKPEYDLNEESFLEAIKMLNKGINQVHTIINNGFIPLDTEVVMGSVNLGYFGQCDNIWLGKIKKNIVVLMTDYKTNLEKNFVSQPWNKPMKSPFNHLLDTDLSKYFIQQPLYAQLFKDMLKDTKYSYLDFIGFRIIHTRGEGKIIKIPTQVYNEVKSLYPVK